MNQPARYGKASSEQRAEENEVCREIVKELENLSLSDRQKLLVVYLLAMGLENMEHTRAIVKVVRELPGNDMFLIGPAEKEEADGSPDIQR